MELQPGDELRVSYKEGRKKIIRQCIIVNNNENQSFIVVDYGMYKGTIDRFAVGQGQVGIELIKRAG